MHDSSIKVLFKYKKLYINTNVVANHNYLAHTQVLPYVTAILPTGIYC